MLPVMHSVQEHNAFERKHSFHGFFFGGPKMFGWIALCYVKPLARWYLICCMGASFSQTKPVLKNWLLCF